MYCLKIKDKNLYHSLQIATTEFSQVKKIPADTVSGIQPLNFRLNSSDIRY